MSQDENLPSCPICHEPATDVSVKGHIIHVECLECGTFEILELAAQHIQDYAHDDRQRLLDKAKRNALGQDGPPLIREPFTF
jgi:hypothetical protein